MENKNEKHLNKRKKQKILVAVTAVLLAIICFLSGFFVNRLINGRKLNKIADILRIMESVGFVFDENGNPREITEEEYADALVNGILDKYSAYFTDEEYAEYVSKGKGNSSGIGVSFYDNDNTIDKIAGNSPADKVGLQVGDKIVSFEINSNVSNALDYNSIKDFLNGVSSNVDFKITVERDGNSLSFTIKKTAYQISYVTYYDNEVKYCFEGEDNQNLLGKTYYDDKYIALGDDIAYIKFAGFEGQASNQLFNALDYMKERRKTKLILDLRDNGGGYMSVLTEVAGALINWNGKNNFAVAISEGKKTRETFYSGKNRFNTDIVSIVVLADERTASASECLIGAMAYYGGEFTLDKLVIEKSASGKVTTFGKGIMQTTYGLIGGGALKLTTARILWPDGTTCIHGKGIETKVENQVEKSQVISRAIEILS